MISVLFRTESHYSVPKAPIVAAVREALTAYGATDAEVSVSIVGDRQMRTLNQRYRGRDASSDVLSFCLNDPTQHNDVQFVDSPDGVLRLGDVIISYPKARESAARDGVMVEDKVRELVLHGIDHLIGRHHDNE